MVPGCRSLCSVIATISILIPNLSSLYFSWVYKEEGSQCYVKAENGVAQDVNATAAGLLVHSGDKACHSPDTGEK